jgi:hypothetical protein
LGNGDRIETDKVVGLGMGKRVRMGRFMITRFWMGVLMRMMRMMRQ